MEQSFDLVVIGAGMAVISAANKCAAVKILINNQTDVVLD